MTYLVRLASGAPASSSKALCNGGLAEVDAMFAGAYDGCFRPVYRAEWHVLNAQGAFADGNIIAAAKCVLLAPS